MQNAYDNLARAASLLHEASQACGSMSIRTNRLKNKVRVLGFILECMCSVAPREENELGTGAQMRNARSEAG